MFEHEDIWLNLEENCLISFRDSIKKQMHGKKLNKETMRQTWSFSFCYSSTIVTIKFLHNKSFSCCILLFLILSQKHRKTSRTNVMQKFWWSKLSKNQQKEKDHVTLLIIFLLRFLPIIFFSIMVSRQCLVTNTNTIVINIFFEKTKFYKSSVNMKLVQNKN